MSIRNIVISTAIAATGLAGMCGQSLAQMKAVKWSSDLNVVGIHPDAFPVVRPVETDRQYSQYKIGVESVSLNFDYVVVTSPEFLDGEKKVLLRTRKECVSYGPLRALYEVLPQGFILTKDLAKRMCKEPDWTPVCSDTIWAYGIILESDINPITVRRRR